MDKLMLLIPLLCLCIGLVLLLTKKAMHIGRIFIMLAILPVILLVVVVAILSIAPSNVHGGIYSYIILALGFLVAVWIGCGLWGVLKKKAVWIPLCACMGLCVLIMIGFSAYQYHLDNLPTVTESDGLLAEYAPYVEDSKVAQLDGESDLRIAEDFPVMDGATALYPVYSAFAKAVYPKDILDDITVLEKTTHYIENHPYIPCSTTTGAYHKIAAGEVDIIFAAAPSKEQAQFAENSGVELVYTPIGREAFVFFVNSKNPIDDISLAQIQDIYSGKVTDWSALGVRGLGKIRAFQRDEGSGSQSALIRLMDGKELMTPPREDVVSGMGGIISRTADYKNFKNAIGYSFRFYSTEMVQNNQIKLLNINGIAPTLENIENGTYPIASEFYAVTRKDATENTQKLLDWILSEQGQSLIEKTGYTPIR